MASLCSHVYMDHKVAEAELKVKTFPNYQEVETVFLLLIVALLLDEESTISSSSLTKFVCR
jgi:hypothetical protein